MAVERLGGGGLFDADDGVAEALVAREEGDEVLPRKGSNTKEIRKKYMLRCEC